MAWAAFVIFLLAMALVSAATNRNAFVNSANPFAAVLLVAVGSAVVVFCVWLAVVLPITLLIPHRSVLWELQYLIVIGAVAGPLIVFLGGIYQIESNPTIQPRSTYLLSGIAFPGVPSAIIGGITGAIAAYLHKQWMKKESQFTEA
jgi:hypothetical protein